MVALAAGCRGPTPVPSDGLLQPLAGRSVIAPSESDLAVARLAEAALAAGPEDSKARMAMEWALAELREHEEIDERFRERMEMDLRARETIQNPVGPSQRKTAERQRWERRESDESHLVPLGLDLVNATLNDPRAYRLAARKLLASETVGPRLKERLKRQIDDDPLRLATRRDLDHLSRRFAHTFNAIAEPLGKSVMTGFVMAPYQIAMSGLYWLVGLFEGDPISTQERQALAHRKRFLRLYPDAPESEKVRFQVMRDQADLTALFADRYNDAAETALESGKPRLAAATAKRALMQVGNDRRAGGLLQRAETILDRIDEDRARSRGVDDARLDDLGADPERTREVAEALWLGPDELLAAAVRFQRAHRDDELSDEAAYVMALARNDKGYEIRSWDDLRAIANLDARQSNMSRHASALVSNPWQNPYDTFRYEQVRGFREGLRHELLGQWSKGPRYKNLPKLVGYLVDLPSMVRTIVLTPIRAALGVFRGRPDFHQTTAVAAYRYLGVYPEGEHAEEVFQWLIDYEEDRGNFEAALRLADFRPGFDSDRRREWVEKAADHRLQAAAKIKRRDQRGTVLKAIVREYPDSAAGHTAGIEARNQVVEATAQQIRMTRNFLEENPEVAGHDGLGLRRELLDGKLANGELHPAGVAFLGGRQIEFSLIDQTGDEDNLPVRVRKMVSPERLSRAVALLDETAMRNARVDRDDFLTPDAKRDTFFERARLGLTDKVDPRPTAESDYVFKGMRERYGVVRGRESILPFDLVLQGSLEDMSLGAFPRWRSPPETPDAFLYK